MDGRSVSDKKTYMQTQCGELFIKLMSMAMEKRRLSKGKV